MFTRCRPYRKNDQAWVEQKNGIVVRRIVGYRRLEGAKAAAALAQLYATVRLYVNFFQPSFKLARKDRDGARVKKHYHSPATPCQRLLMDARTPQQVRRRAEAIRTGLDPVRLLSEMRAAQKLLVEIADSTLPAEVNAPTLDQVGDLDRVMTIEKSVLVALPRQPGLQSDADTRAFGRALARKSSRYAFPDPFVDLVRPLQKRMVVHIAQQAKKVSMCRA